MMVIKGNMSKGCYDCEFCDTRNYFDGNEWHCVCSILRKEVSDDGDKDENCPIIGDITESEYARIMNLREYRKMKIPFDEETISKIHDYYNTVNNGMEGIFSSNVENDPLEGIFSKH